MTHGFLTASCVACVRRAARTPPWTPLHRIAVQHLTTAPFLSKPVRPLLSNDRRLLTRPLCAKPGGAVT
jgi:hypothetical protein